MKPYDKFKVNGNSQVYKIEFMMKRNINSNYLGFMPSITNNFRIRKLTPLEYVRLMDFDDEDYYKMAKVNSNTQIYKQCGNSIVVKVLEKILEELIK